MNHFFLPNYDKNLSEKELLTQYFLNHREKLYIPAGHMINLELPHCLYLILAGFLKQYFLNHAGKQKTFMFLEKGQVLGEISFFQGPIEYFVTQAITDTVLLPLNAKKLKDGIAQHPALMNSVLILETEKLRILMAQIYEENYMPVKERLFSFLNRISLYQSEKTIYGHKILLRLTHEELAAHIGTTRSTITRSLKELNAEGKIKIYEHYLYIQK